MVSIQDEMTVMVQPGEGSLGQRRSHSGTFGGAFTAADDGYIHRTCHQLLAQECGAPLPLRRLAAQLARRNRESSAHCLACLRVADFTEVVVTPVAYGVSRSACQFHFLQCRARGAKFVFCLSARPLTFRNPGAVLLTATICYAQAR